MSMIEGIGGPTANYEHGWTHDESIALGNSFSDSSGTTTTTTSTLTYSVLPGLYYNSEYHGFLFRSADRCANDNR